MADLEQIVNEFNALRPRAQKEPLPTGARVEVDSEWIPFESTDAQFHDGGGMSGYTRPWVTAYHDPRLNDEEITRIAVSIDPEGIMSMRLRS